MKPEYWLERWQLGRIGFHRDEANPRLVEQRSFFNDCLRVLVPLCGKSHDLDWLAAHGAGQHAIALVREGGQLDADEQNRVFGESLPRGLRVR